MTDEHGLNARKRILVLASFFGSDPRWISDFCPKPRYVFKKAKYETPERSWHSRGATTPVAEWVRHWLYTRRAMKWQADCIVTCFPQLALVAAALLRLSGDNSTRLVAWHFNLGSLRSKWKGWLAGTILNRVDRFVLHSRGEIKSYAAWMGIDESKFFFIPLQRGAIPQLVSSTVPKPYIVSMGSAQRDYGTLIDAVRGSGIRTVIIAKKSIIDRLPDDPNIVKLHGLTERQCDTIVAGAELSVVPIEPTETASGQVTFITSMRMGIPTIATDSVGTVDYIRNGETGLLVPPRDAQALRRAIVGLWNDAALRARVGTAARTHAVAQFSDEAAAWHLAKLLDEIVT